jgi:oligopeptide/dipeptide ABC transporter ATP-binding protein
MREMQEEVGTAIVLITHNMGIVAQYANRIGIMYAGTIIEEGTVGGIFEDPRHPYSRGLLSCIPHLVHGDPGQVSPLPDIPGVVPEPGARPAGCAFAPRCALATPVCTERRPEFLPQGPTRQVACFAARNGTGHLPELHVAS